MKLILQIPCFNEAETLPVTLAALPRLVPGFDRVEWLVVDDGSLDETAEVARRHGVDHVVRLPRNQGLAHAFSCAIEASLAEGADVIVNLDADNQYDARDIPSLVAPILAGTAQLVVGSRPIETIGEFSPLKKLLQRLGSWVVRIASRTSVPDAPSGFRAMSREAASQLNVFSDYTYTLETIIQAGQRGMAVTSVPVRTNPALRPSRLMTGVTSYVRRSVLTIVRIFMTYRSFEFFAIPGAVSLLAGLALGVRFLFYYLGEDGATGHVQSVILGALLMGVGVALIVVGLVADLISANRKLMEKTDAHLHRLRDRLEVIERRLESRGGASEPAQARKDRSGG